jgi:hypothetical protein
MSGGRARVWGPSSGQGQEAEAAELEAEVAELEAESHASFHSWSFGSEVGTPPSNDRAKNSLLQISFCLAFRYSAREERFYLQKDIPINQQHDNFCLFKFVGERQ